MQRTVYDQVVTGPKRSATLAKGVAKAHPGAKVERLRVAGSKPPAWRIIAQLPKGKG